MGNVGGDGSRSAETVWNTFVSVWGRIFSMPEVMAVDTGTEFQGHFAEMVVSNGIALLPTDARAPWQNGRTERAEKEWKRQLKLARRKEEPQTEAELTAMGELCCGVRNRYNNRSGFSPMQRVFGFTTRLPNSILSDDLIDPMYLSMDPLAVFKRPKELRTATTRAWAALDSRLRLQKALRACHRVPENFTDGQMVSAWRQP